MKIIGQLGLLVTCAVFAPAYAQFGNFNLNKLLDKGKSIVDAQKPINESDEINIGEGAAAVMLGAIPLHRDTDLQKYVNRVGRWVATQTTRPDLPWTFGVLDTPTINAFAMPGGKIFVSAGLLAKLRSESELAGVLGHEIAHVMQRHTVKVIEATRSAGAWAAIGQDVLSDRIAQSKAAGNPLVGALATTAGAEGIDLVKKGLFLRPLDRALEYEADRIGALLSAKAGYDPYGYIAVLQTLAALKPEDGGSLSLSTHPSANERLAELEKYATTLDRYAGQFTGDERFAKVIAAIK